MRGDMPAEYLGCPLAVEVIAEPALVLCRGGKLEWRTRVIRATLPDGTFARFGVARAAKSWVRGRLHSLERKKP